LSFESVLCSTVVFINSPEKSTAYPSLAAAT